MSPVRRIKPTTDGIAPSRHRSCLITVFSSQNASILYNLWVEGSGGKGRVGLSMNNVKYEEGVSAEEEGGHFGLDGPERLEVVALLGALHALGGEDAGENILP